MTSRYLECLGHKNSAFQVVFLAYLFCINRYMEINKYQ